MQKISEDNKKVILDIIKTISMLLMVAVIIFCLVLSAVFIGVVFEVRPEYKSIFDDKINESLSSVTAFAAEEDDVISSPDSVNSVPLAPGAVLVYEDYEEELLPLWSYGGDTNSVDLSSLNLTGGTYQVVCKGYNAIGVSFFLTNLILVDMEFPVQCISVSDYGSGDIYFDVNLYIEPPYAELYHDTFFNALRESEGAYVMFYALYKIEDNSSDESISDSFFGAISDGVTFGFDAIPSGITYIFDELFVHEGKLTTYSYAVFSLCGVAIVLGLIKFLLSYLFSLGGK